MATRADLELIQGDDPTVALAVTRDGSAHNLTGLRVELLVKPSQTSDDTAAVYQLSSVGASPKITVTNAAGGLAVADFVDRLAVAGTWWYRAWVATASDPALNRQTFAYGRLIVTPA